MEEKTNYLLATLNVYTYGKHKKIKCDYSCIPVTPDDKNWKSLVSNEIIDGKKYRYRMTNLSDVDMVKFSKNKDTKACEVSIIAVGTLEDDERKTIEKIYNLFNEHFWYKFSYKKFLEKKISIGQI